MKKKKSLRGLLHWAKKTMKKKRNVAVVYWLLRLSVIAIMVAQFFNHNFENVFLCVLTLVLLLMPTIMERRLKIDLPNALEIIIMLFIYAAEIMGEIQAFYTTYRGWDTMLHTMNGFLCAAIGFCLVDLFDRSEKSSLSLSPKYMAIVAFCFSMTVGVLWEFFECAMDQLLFLDMQKDTVVNTISTVMLDPAGGNKPQIIRGITDVILVTDQGEISLGLGGYLDIGLLDTMKDLFVNFIGAVVFSVTGFFYARSKGERRTPAQNFVPSKKTEETDYLRQARERSQALSQQEAEPEEK